MQDALFPFSPYPTGFPPRLAQDETARMDLSARQGRHEQGQRIQRAAQRAALSIEELAGRIGCSRALIYQYCSGTTLAQPDRLQQIAQECGVPLTYFYADTVSDDPGFSSDFPDSAPAASVPPISQEVSLRVQDSLRAAQELASAQESPPDYRALAATCERILSLAAQVGDRKAQAQAQKKLGNAHLRIGDYPRAAEALARAVTLAQEAEDAEDEAASRQSLGNALLAMGRIREAREQFTQIVGGTSWQGRWQGTLSLGCIHEMQGEYQLAMARFDETDALLDAALTAGGLSSAEVAEAALYAQTNRRNVYMDGGDFRAALVLADRGLAEAEALGNADQHLEARFDKAWCDFATGKWREAHNGFAATIQLARFVGDQGRETLARGWLGLFLAAAGDHDAAIACGKDALALALSRGDRRAELYAQLALADAYAASWLREAEARYHTNQALAVTAALRHERGEIECRLRLARLAAQTGEGNELRDAADRALTLALRLGARHLEALARCWLAEGLLLETENGNATPENAALRQMQASDHARAAQRLADETEFIEARWRSRDLLARIALRQEASLMEREGGLQLLRESVEIVEGLRTELRASEASDSLLENSETLELYVRFAYFLRLNGQADAMRAFLERAGWPPLTARLNRDDAE